MLVNATQLAERLGVSKARVSQYVSQGVLNGCFQGDGRGRRFDLTLVQRALSRGLDPGQMLGNGAETRRAIRDLTEDGAALPEPAPSAAARSDRLLSNDDADAYQLIRTQQAEEILRKQRRENARDENLWVLSEEVERNASRLLSREIGQFEMVLRDGARTIADKMGVDFREVRQILMQEWRSHRARQSSVLAGEAETVGMTDAELAADV